VDGHVANAEKGGVMKLSGVLWGLTMLLPFDLVAHAQGPGDAQRGAQVFNQCKICHSLEDLLAYLNQATR
jgi:hypothetical protein